MKHRARILVVDDQPVNVQLLERVLTKAGYEVVVAMNGRECLEEVARHPPDMILLDVMMPEMDGVEVCELLQEDPRMKAVPILFITARDSKEGKLEGLQAGAVDYIIKPIDVDETLAKVGTHLRFLEIHRENVDLQRRLGETRRTAAMGAITQGIAHNLNNLLGVIMGYLELMKMQQGDAAKMQRNLDKIETAIHRVVRIIKQLSNVAFSTRLPSSQARLGSILQNSIQRVEEAVGKKVPVHVTLHSGDVEFRTNIEALEDALGKLLLNAWESYGEHFEGERPIELSVSRKPIGEMNTDTMEFLIEDQGLGIDPSLRDNIFEPFISSKSTVGVGMGLTVARHSIRTLGGEIRLEDNPSGKGTIVIFTHPVQPRA